MIRFNSGTQVIMSSSLKEDIPAILREEGSRSVALVLDGNVSSHDRVSELIEALGNGFRLSLFEIRSSEPTTDMVDEYAAKVRGNAIDMFIAIGGGSVIDLTKALSVMAVNDGSVEEYHGTGRPFSSGVKKIMVPTTAGTGSEVTPGAVLVNPATKFKRAISGRFVMPDYAVLDPALTLTLPDGVIASTGMDAVGHAVESFTARCANDVTRMYSKRAFSLVFNNLPRIFEDRNNIEPRRRVLLGSCLAGTAIHNSNTGACHSMAYALGIYNKIPHGLAVALLLPYVVRLNVSRGCYLYAELYDLIEGGGSGGSARDRAERFAASLENYAPLSYIGRSFADFGVGEKNRDFLAERGLDLATALSNNPVEFGLNDARDALRGAHHVPV